MIYKDAELYGVCELLEAEHALGKLPLRIPNDLRLKLNQGAQAAALACSGCEVRFNLRSDSAQVILKSTEGTSVAEVYQGCFFRSWHPVGVEATEITVELPGDMDLLNSVTQQNRLTFDAGLTRIILPCRPAVELIDIQGEFDLPRAEQTPPMKYLAYGSSITHFSSAVRPTGCYAHKTAQLLGFDLINLGFGGGAHLEREMADYIAGRADWDIASLEMGINLIWYIDADEFAERVGYFVARIARSHPNKWVFCTDLFTCAPDFEGDQKVTAFREVVREKVEELSLPRLVYVPGGDLLTSPGGLTADLVHPGPFGMDEIAANLSEVIRDKMG